MYRKRGYATPKTDVRAFILRNNRILMVKEAADGLWSLPGGWADVGDTPSKVVRREVEEETGLKVRVTKLLGVWDQSSRPSAFTLACLQADFFL